LTEPLREAPASPGGAKKKIGLALTVAIFLLALAGYFYWGPKDRIDPLKPITAQDTHESEAPAQSDPVVEPLEPVIVAFGTADESRLKTAADNLDRLRSELIEKQDEIDELRTYYQAGIDAEIQGVVDTIRQADNGGI
jgi:flagellar basal body-associated protein FliL